MYILPNIRTLHVCTLVKGWCCICPAQGEGNILKRSPEKFSALTWLCCKKVLQVGLCIGNYIYRFSWDDTTNIALRKIGPMFGSGESWRVGSTKAAGKEGNSWQFNLTRTCRPLLLYAREKFPMSGLNLVTHVAARVNYFTVIKEC